MNVLIVRQNSVHKNIRQSRLNQRDFSLNKNNAAKTKMILNYKPALPDTRFPIVILGTGGIVKDAHLPAYRMASFPVDTLMNRTLERAQALAAMYGVKKVFRTVAEAVANAPFNPIFDLALPASMFADTLSQLPDGAHVLIQKPMGETLAQAKEILAVCRQKKLNAAINCQLRYAPFVLAARQIIDSGVIGDLIDMEMRLTCHTPWHLFPFLRGLPRVEMVYHSVHYVDLIRSFLGQPSKLQALTLPHPHSPGLASTRSTIIMKYQSGVRATITTNHNHDFGARHQESYLKWEGTKGAIWARVGLLMDYPRGAGDMFEYYIREEGRQPEWKSVVLEGSWCPEAFVGTMASVQRHKEGSEKNMATSVEDVIHTMECVEAAYLASEGGGISPETLK
jgi:predicted dehydrogenase